MEIEPSEDQTRMFRMVRVPPRIEYGWWRTTGKSKRFQPIRCWPLGDISQAKEAMEMARIAVFTELDQLPGVDAEAIKPRHLIKRDFRNAPGDIVGLIEAGRKGLEVDELPTVEESHAKLQADVPALRGDGGRQFYLYLNDTIYRKLVAMAVAAKTNRNRMIEAMILFTGTMDWDKEPENGADNE